MNSTVTSLDLGGNWLGKGGAQAIAANGGTQSLREVLRGEQLERNRHHDPPGFVVHVCVFITSGPIIKLCAVHVCVHSPSRLLS